MFDCVYMSIDVVRYFNFYRTPIESDSCFSVEGPLQVTLELRPLTTSSWTYIQGLSQNPRLRCLDKYNHVLNR